MARLARNIVFIVGYALFFAVIAGCATTQQKVTVLYQPVVTARGGSGELYLAAAGGHQEPGKTGDVQSVIGKVKNSDGDQIGEIVTPVAPGDLFLDAFRRELSNAGYKIIQLDSLPADVSKGLAITMTGINLEEISSIIKSEGSCRLTISLELWKNGKGIKKLYYESAFSDFAIKDRDLLLQDILQKSLQDLMKQAVPDIIKELGK